MDIQSNRVSDGVRKWFHEAMVDNSPVDECTLDVVMKSAESVSEIVRRACDLLVALSAAAAAGYPHTKTRFVVLFMFPDTPTIRVWQDSFWDQLKDTIPIVLRMLEPERFYEHFPEEYYRTLSLPIDDPVPIECTYRSYLAQLLEPDDFSSGIYLTTAKEGAATSQGST